MIPHTLSAACTFGSVKSIPPNPRPLGRLVGAPLGGTPSLGTPPPGNPLGGLPLGIPLGIPLGRSGTSRPAALRQEMILVNCSRLPWKPPPWGPPEGAEEEAGAAGEPVEGDPPQATVLMAATSSTVAMRVRSRVRRRLMRDMNDLSGLS